MPCIELRFSSCSSAKSLEPSRPWANVKSSIPDEASWPWYPAEHGEVEIRSNASSGVTLARVDNPADRHRSDDRISHDCGGCDRSESRSWQRHPQLSAGQRNQAS